MSLYPPFCLLSVQSYMDSNYGGQHPFRICLFLVILVCAMDVKEGMSKMPNHLTIFAFNTRTGVLSPQVDLQHPPYTFWQCILLLQCCLHFCCMLCAITIFRSSTYMPNWTLSTRSGPIYSLVFIFRNFHPLINL